jgi:hypothetical protein
MVYNDVQTLPPTPPNPIHRASSNPSTCSMVFHAYSNEIFEHLVGDGEDSYGCAMGCGKRVLYKGTISKCPAIPGELIRAGGILDKHTIRNTLGKRQPKQRMWGLQGAVPLGIRVVANSTQQAPLLDFLLALQESQAIVQI